MTDCPGWIFKKHDYDEWKIVSQGDVYSPSLFKDNSRVIGFWTEQQRTCKNCGYTQTKADKVMG